MPRYEKFIDGNTVTLKRMAEFATHAGHQNFSFLNAASSYGDRATVTHEDLDLLMGSIQLMWRDDEPVCVVAMGNYASKILDRLKVKHLKIPHLSMRCRIWNDKTMDLHHKERVREWAKGPLFWTTLSRSP